MSGSEAIAKRDRNDMPAARAGIRGHVPASARSSPVRHRTRAEDAAGPYTIDGYRDGPLSSPASTIGLGELATWAAPLSAETQGFCLDSLVQLPYDHLPVSHAGGVYSRRRSAVDFDQLLRLSERKPLSLGWIIGRAAGVPVDQLNGPECRGSFKPGRSRGIVRGTTAATAGHCTKVDLDARSWSLSR